MEKKYMAVDQYGQTYHGLEKPRRDLMERLGRKHCAKMYVDTKDGDARHCGYIIGGLWLSIYEVKPINS
jgi:hypothetical protein